MQFYKKFLIPKNIFFATKSTKNFLTLEKEVIKLYFEVR